jgi:hypothetical protein
MHAQGWMDSYGWIVPSAKEQEWQQSPEMNLSAN